MIDLRRAGILLPEKTWNFCILSPCAVINRQLLGQNRSNRAKIGYKWIKESFSCPAKSTHLHDEQIVRRAVARACLFKAAPLCRIFQAHDIEQTRAQCAKKISSWKNFFPFHGKQGGKNARCTD
jgi:hypothetical protein